MASSDLSHHVVGLDRRMHVSQGNADSHTVADRKSFARGYREPCADRDSDCRPHCFADTHGDCCPDRNGYCDGTFWSDFDGHAWDLHSDPHGDSYFCGDAYGRAWDPYCNPYHCADPHPYSPYRPAAAFAHCHSRHIGLGHCPGHDGRHSFCQVRHDNDGRGNSGNDCQGVDEERQDEDGVHRGWDDYGAADRL